MENIFGKKPLREQYIPPPLPVEFYKENSMTPSVKSMQKGTCGCGRSPTGNCCGWHALTEEQFVERKELYETGKADLAGREVK
jgi:hypothetical protein